MKCLHAYLIKCLTCSYGENFVIHPRKGSVLRVFRKDGIDKTVFSRFPEKSSEDFKFMLVIGSTYDFRYIWIEPIVEINNPYSRILKRRSNYIFLPIRSFEFHLILMPYWQTLKKAL